MNNTLTLALSLGDLISSIILTITAYVVWLYTKETQKSNEIQERPVLNFYLRGYEMRVRNVGKGPAYNVHISSLTAGGLSYIPSFNQPNFILEPTKDEKTFIFEVIKETGGFEIFGPEPRYFELFVDRLFPRNLDQDEYEKQKKEAGIFVFNYQGTSGKVYYSIFRLYPQIRPLLNVYKLAVEYIESGEGKCDIARARKICSKKEVLFVTQ